MKKKIKENGRSMVEMLGVLAIIGVLSIGGIAGYTMAMNRYKANQILDKAAKLYAAVQASPYVGMDLSELQNATDGEGWKSIFQSLGMNANGPHTSTEPEARYGIWTADEGVYLGSISEGVAKALLSMGMKVSASWDEESTVIVFSNGDANAGF